MANWNPFKFKIEVGKSGSPLSKMKAKPYIRDIPYIRGYTVYKGYTIYHMYGYIIYTHIVVWSANFKQLVRNDY